MNPATACDGTFKAHSLEFANGTRMRELRTYASNGAGLAVNDLDDDGDLDLVFASIDGNSVVLWNEGGFQFTRQELADANTRAASSVDVDGDGRLDLVFTHRTGGVSYWRNLGGRQFAQAELPGVNAFAYALAWGDLNGDGALDLVTGSYAAELAREGVDAAAIKDRAGVFYYEHTPNGFAPHRLATTAQTLSIALVDVDGDGADDVWVANDFVEQDDIWLRRGGQWEKAQPFPITSHSTMSIDWADLDNDGSLALFTTDMSPYDISVENMARWLPMMAATQQQHTWGDPQVNQNMLLVRDAGAWTNAAPRAGVDATGWSWAGRFGDLDNDGHLDLYVVNGMIASDLFGHLHNDELVETNRAFRNRGDGTFALADEWQLNGTSSGRGMTMADLDSDGDLDVVINNLRNSAQVFENRLCAGRSLQVDLRWAGANVGANMHGNSRAIGAWVELHTDQGTLRRDVRATSGYLTGDASRVHFGLPAGATPQFLQVVWPDGATSQIPFKDLNLDLTLNQRLTVTR